MRGDKQEGSGWLSNDRWHTAVHEAGHAVTGRVLGMECGLVTIAVDHDRACAGHSITHDPWVIADAWERRGKFRDPGTIMRGRIMTYMAGAEAEIALLGSSEGDVVGCRDIADMLDSRHTAAAGADRARLEDRLRRMTRMLVRRHVGKIDALARALWIRETIEDDAEIRTAAGLSPRRWRSTVGRRWGSAPRSPSSLLTPPGIDTMPILSNPRRECFAQELAKGRPAYLAHKDAGLSGGRSR